MSINKKLKNVFVFTLSIALVSCAAGQQSFIATHQSMDDVRVCRNILKDKDFLTNEKIPKNELETNYKNALVRAKNKRGLTYSECQEKVNKADNQLTAALLGIAAAALVVDAANNSGGSGYQPYGSTGYAWDLIDHPTYAYQTIYVCRNKANGQFAEQRFCSNKVKNDSTWPGT